MTTVIALCFVVPCVTAAALTCWAFVALDLGRRAIEHAKASEERRAANEHAKALADHDRRLTRLETAERQTASVLASRVR